MRGVLAKMNSGRRMAVIPEEQRRMGWVPGYAKEARIDWEVLNCSLLPEPRSPFPPFLPTFVGNVSVRAELPPFFSD